MEVCIQESMAQSPSPGQRILESVKEGLSAIAAAKNELGSLKRFKGGRDRHFDNVPAITCKDGLGRKVRLKFADSTLDKNGQPTDTS